MIGTKKHTQQLNHTFLDQCSLMNRHLNPGVAQWMHVKFDLLLLSCIDHCS